MAQTHSNTISKFDIWILAARPKTLTAAIAPVVVGTTIAIHDNKFNYIAFLIALFCSLLIQIGTNFTNDLFDFLKGTDKKGRLGPARTVASGLLSVSEMKTGIICAFGTAFLLGLYLVYTGGSNVLLIGVASILAGIAYTAGPFPLAYNGLGDIFVFLFFGCVGTVGTYYVQAHEVSAFVFWASVPVGALVTNILVINNFRDLEGDKESGKNTLAVLFGARFSQIQYLFFLIISYAVLVVVYITFKRSAFVFLPLLSLPLSIKLVRMIYTLKGKDLNKTLALTGKLSGLYALLFALGILL
jgi:1,4-dihydroxy-2-naphthoate polyprenyltransferase